MRPRRCCLFQNRRKGVLLLCLLRHNVSPSWGLQLGSYDKLLTRRLFCGIASVTTLSSCSPIDPSCATAPSSIQINTTSSILEVDYKAVAADIAALVDRVPYRGPTLVRLAWHSSGTYDAGAASYTTPEVIVGGSSSGTIRFDEELAHEANAGLKQSAVRFLEPIKEKYGPGLSYADLYTLAGGKSIYLILWFLPFFLTLHKTDSKNIFIGHCSGRYQGIGRSVHRLELWPSGFHGLFLCPTCRSSSLAGFRSTRS